MNSRVATSIALSALLLVGTAQATLIDNGDGTVSDNVSGLMWLKDANYAMTSGYDTDGKMTWDDAMTWASGLSFAGHDDWRLPIVIDQGNDGCNFGYSGTDCGFNVDLATGELADLWYRALGNTPYYDTSGSGPQAGWGLSNTGPFVNLQSDLYWTGTEYLPNIVHGVAWFFYTDYGNQGGNNKFVRLRAWAVRAARVPEPATVLLMGVGLAGLGAMRRRR